MSDDLDFNDMLGISDPIPSTPHADMYREWTIDRNFSGKPISPRIYNFHIWLKHELFVYQTLYDNDCILHYKQSGREITRNKLVRELSRHFFMMHALVKFDNERAREQGKEVNIDQFLDLIMENPNTKKLIENHNILL